MITPRQKDDALLADIKSCQDSDDLHVWWLGQSGFLVQHQTRHLLLDPYLSDSLTKKYATTDKPHTRMTERVVDPARLDFIDVATSSHNHTDHLDAETLMPLMQANPEMKLIIAEANRAFVAERLDINPIEPIGLNDGDSAEAGGFTFSAVPAAHEDLERDANGRCRFLGYIVEVGPWKIYHSGDTIPYDGMEDLLRPFEVDIAILPINGRAPERRVAGNFHPEEAAELGKQIGARVVIPCHYDMFTFNTADPADFARACEAKSQSYKIMQCGERFNGSDI